MLKTKPQLENAIIKLKFKNIVPDNMPVETGIFIECEPALFDEIAKESLGISALLADQKEIKVLTVSYLGIKVTLIKGKLPWNNN
jgi:hypothetical protein